MNFNSDLPKLFTVMEYNTIISCDGAFRLACRSAHYRFVGDISTTTQAPPAAKGRPSDKQRLIDQSTSSPLFPQLQIAESWLLILFNFRAMPLGEKTRSGVASESSATLKQWAMITRRSGHAVSGKLVWNQLKVYCIPISTFADSFDTLFFVFLNQPLLLSMNPSLV